MSAVPDDSPTAHPAASKLITGTFPDDGTAQDLIKALKADKGVITANMYPCRGLGGADEPGGLGSLPAARPVQVVSVVVPADRVDELFNYICNEANIYRLGGGFVYQNTLHSATPFSLPKDIKDEKRSSSTRRIGAERRSEARDTPDRRTGDRRDLQSS